MMMENRPLCIDLYCGLGGWAEGFLSKGYRVVGFDIERHNYGVGSYPGELAIQDVRTLKGFQFKDAACIVASPPCQCYSYMSMPWKRAKKMAEEYRRGMRDVKELTELFDTCFRIQKEASEAAGRHIPMVVENVKGAQPWVGKAKGKFGSFYLWGDVPEMMPNSNSTKGQGRNFQFWAKYGVTSPSFKGIVREAHVLRALELRGIKQGGSGKKWFDRDLDERRRMAGSRRAASALIAKVPFKLSCWIAMTLDSKWSWEDY